jgi:D-glycero-D-manno-heptose 1,7-bisphosphate phosphatase
MILSAPKKRPAAKRTWPMSKNSKKSNKSPAIFFDRDGVLIEDINLLTSVPQVIFLDTVLAAFRLIRNSPFKLIVVSNQPVVARGMATETEVELVNNFIAATIFSETQCRIDKFYFCPHHPEANLPQYRKNCECRKPKPGMLLQAAQEFNLDLKTSWMIGDRISDVIAGHKAACKTILLETGRHLDKPIVSDAMDLNVKPDFTFRNLLKAIEFIGVNQHQ